MILIIGAGLSGLLTAYRLKQKGIPFKVLEARNRVGGRINTVFGKDETPTEMGATWYGSQHKNLIDLLNEFDLEGFQQRMEGKVYFQPFSTAPAQSIDMPTQAPSYRIVGGTSQLIHTLLNKLDAKDVLLGEEVREISFLKDTVEVKTDNVFTGDKVILAMPPKLWSARISFKPELPNDVIAIANETQTWMEDSVKVALTYSQPFWRNNGVSSTLFSNTGPITEFYDHCNYEDSKYALCGFMSPSFKTLNDAERKKAVLSQLENVFGGKALDFLEYRECIWSEEKFTFVNSQKSLYPHQNNGHSIYNNTYYDERLFISSSEASPKFPGYMDGAVYIGNSIAKKIINTLEMKL